MLKKTISYVDYDGQARTEDFYFNLSKRELIKLVHSGKGGLDEQLKEIVRSKDNAAIMRKFEEIILLGYGVRSEDGRRFIKNPQLTEEFSQTAAFEELFVELCVNGQAGIDFINGLVPVDLAQAVARMTQEELLQAAQGDFPPAEQKEDPHKGMLSQPRWPRPQDHLQKKTTPLPEKQILEQKNQPVVVEEERVISRPPHESGPQDTGPDMVNPYGV